MEGSITRISGPVVTISGLKDPKMNDIIRVGDLKLLGEIIKIDGNNAIVQVYEDTTGVRVGEPAENTNMPLSVVLGPGIIGSIFDGTQRPLDKIKAQTGDFIARGVNVLPLDVKKEWAFKPAIEAGVDVKAGQIIGSVKETSLVDYKVMVPPGIHGKLTKVEEGKFTINDSVAKVKQEDGKTVDVMLAQIWPVRKSRPVLDKMPPEIPLITGQRIIDMFFPVAKGGTAAVPGPFGSGKTIIQHQLAKWSDADIIVYVGCGERGNEMTEILTTFPELKDPRSGKPLMERTVLIANTSNMPVAAREASIYTGVTIAEYYRDMGYDVALMADSTSRWAEALREISGRLEEMPGEEGHPSYLSKKISEFYERAGRARLLNGKIGSLTLIGAVSPPGGDISEPVSQSTLRATRVFWALDSSLANRRHFPAINWLNSYSLYEDALMKWFNEKVDKDWSKNRTKAMKLLQREAEINEVAQLVGYDALPEADKMVLDIAKSIREDILRQSALDDVDTYSSVKKQATMLSCVIDLYNAEESAVKNGIAVDKLQGAQAKELIAKFKFVEDGKVEAYTKTVEMAIKDIAKIKESGNNE